MNIYVDPQQNKYLIHEIEFTADSLVLRSENPEISLPYGQVEFQATLCVGSKEIDPLEVLQNTFNETPAAETFHSFRTFRSQSAPVSVISIQLCFISQQQTYQIEMEGLIDLLLEALKEKHPFKKISYTIQNDKPEDPARLKYIKKITTQLDEFLTPQPAEQKTATVPAKTSSHQWLIPTLITVGVLLIVSVIFWVLKG